MYEPYGGSQQGAGRDGDALCFYASGFQAIVALMHHSAKRLGTSLSCPKANPALKRRRIESNKNDDEDGGLKFTCILLSVEVDIAEITPAWALYICHYVRVGMATCCITCMTRICKHVCLCVSNLRGLRSTQVGGKWIKDSATKVTSPTFVHKGALILSDSTRVLLAYLTASYAEPGP